MPKLHEYVDGRGFYIKAAFSGSIVTYQVTPAGNQYLRDRGYRHGSEISRRMLQNLIRRDYVYTGGSGPGEIETEEETGQYKKTTSCQPVDAGDMSVGSMIAAIILLLVCCFFGSNMCNRSPSNEPNKTEQATKIIQEDLQATPEKESRGDLKPTGSPVPADESLEASATPASIASSKLKPTDNPPGDVSFQFEIGDEDSVITYISYKITNMGLNPLMNPRIRVVTRFEENDDVDWDIVWQELPVVLQPGESVSGRESISWLSFNEDSFLNLGYKTLRDSLVEVVWDRYTTRPGVHFYHWQEEEFSRDLPFVIVNNREEPILGAELVVVQIAENGSLSKTIIDDLSVDEGETYRGVAALSADWEQGMSYDAEIVIP